jgi:uncharacterized membrane protein
VGALLALVASLAYGVSDFAAGLASRRFAVGPVAAVAQIFGVITAVIALAVFPGVGPTARVIGWGALSGLGSAVGTLSLYRGLAIGRMSVVAPLSAVLTAIIPAVVGLASGNHLSTGAAVGIGIAIPAIGLVSWQPRSEDRAPSRGGALYGVTSGLGFALLFIALDHAGTHAGAWPLVPGQGIAFILEIPFAIHGFRSSSPPSRATIGLMILGGFLSGTGNLLFLAATGRGQLAIIAVLSSFYPAITILLARSFLSERWTRLQAVGLVTAAAAIALVSTG